MALVYIGLGSNLGDRCENLRRGLSLLAQWEDVCVQAVSAVYETEPVAVRGGDFLNSVCSITTEWEPRELLQILFRIESKLGRSSKGEREARTLDMDILLYEQLIINEPGLVIPHPRLHLRVFVLIPLCEIAPDVIHPVLGSTCRDLLGALKERHRVCKVLPGRALWSTCNGTLSAADDRGSNRCREDQFGEETRS